MFSVHFLHVLHDYTLPTLSLQAFNPKAPLIKEWDFAFDYVAKHDATPTVESLSAGRLGDVSHQVR